MTHKKKTSVSKKYGSRIYSGVAVVFLVAGIGMLIPEDTRTVGVPFIILGITYFVLSQKKPTNKPDK